jgi:hypothetical protein
MSTGKREAKLVDPDEEVDAEVENSMRSVVVDPESKATTVTVTTDLSGEVVTEDITTTNPIDDEESTSGLEVSEEESFETEPQDESDESTGEDNTNWNHEKIYETLQGLPEPPKVGEMDIHEAHEKLSPAEFRQQMIALWKKRQVELKDAIDNIQDDSKYFAKLIEQLYEAEQKGDVDEQLAVMEVLEWEVQDLDKTLVFNFIGGFGVMAERLNSTVLPIRAHAAWVVGSAAKNYHEAQNWVIDHGAVPKLISTLDLEVVNGSENVPAIIEAKKKALYALSVLVRANERGQRLFLLHSGPDVLAKLAAEVYPTNVQHKVSWFVLHEYRPCLTLYRLIDLEGAVASIRPAARQLRGGVSGRGQDQLGTVARRLSGSRVVHLVLLLLRRARTFVCLCVAHPPPLSSCTVV